MNAADIKFLGKRMNELRLCNNCTMDDLVIKLRDANYGTINKSSLSRVENGETKTEKKILEYAEMYCDVFHLTDAQKKQFLRGGKIAIPDTSALLRNTHLIDELNKEFSRVVIPDVVITELRNFKYHNSGALGKKAWEVLNGINYGDRTIMMKYEGPDNDDADMKIMHVAQSASINYGAKVEILTYDVDYSAYLKGNSSIAALYLREYMATKQALVNMDKIERIDAYYADTYDNAEVPSKEEVDAYMSNGNTLLISCVRNIHIPIEQRKEKIKWLLKHGADVDKRASSGRFLPALSQAIQMHGEDSWEMFSFLLDECNADPNVGSRNPLGSGKVRQKNEGNMPLMIAAWHGKTKFVQKLCDHERISINQQDENGFTALIKAYANGYFECGEILLKAGADKKIVDIDGKTYEDHINDFHELGKMSERGTQKKKKPHYKNRYNSKKK